MIDRIRKEYCSWIPVTTEEAEAAYNKMSESEFNSIYVLMGNYYYKRIIHLDDEIKLTLLYKIHEKLKFFWILGIISVFLFVFYFIYLIASGKL